MNEKILLYGGSGYIGSEFKKHFCENGIEFSVVKRGFRIPFGIIRPTLIINCSAFIGHPSVDKNKDHPAETIRANVLLPMEIAQRSFELDIPVVHLSTACLYDEEREYSESDIPIRGFDGYCGFYVGTKLIAEEAVKQFEKHYILRLRLPFDNISSTRNYLNKMIEYPKIFDHVNSLTHRGDFVKAAIGLWRNKAAFGTYHVCQPGQISNRDVLAKMQKAGLIKGEKEFIPGNCTGCRVSTMKLQDTGVLLRSVEEAVDESIKEWKS